MKSVWLPTPFSIPAMTETSPFFSPIFFASRSLFLKRLMNFSSFSVLRAGIPETE